MPQVGDVIVSPATGIAAKFLKTGDGTEDSLLRIEFTLQPDGIGPPLHFHRGQEERYHILEGTLGLRVDDEDLRLPPGGTAHVPENAKHTFWNAGREPVRFTSEHSPSLRFGEFLESLYLMEADGLCGRDGMPNFIRFCTLMNHHRGEQYVVGPPAFVQDALSVILGAIGRGLGYRGDYSSPIARERMRKYAAGPERSRQGP